MWCYRYNPKTFPDISTFLASFSDMTITSSAVDSLAESVFIELSPSEREELILAMNEQMKIIHALDPLPTDIPASSSPGVLRDDLPHQTISPEALLAGVPKTRDGFVVAPDIPHQTLN